AEAALPNGGAALDTPSKLIAATGRCRVVVTAAYHAAVFALAQGVPVVGVGSSSYYLRKFEGLAAEFRGGCQVVRTDATGLAADLEAAVAVAWEAAPGTRSALLGSAARQVECGRAAYQRLATLCAPARSSEGR